MALFQKEMLVRYRYPIGFVLSLVSFLAAGWMVKNYLDMKEREIRQEVLAQQDMVDVVVAKGDLPVGAEISGKTMSIRKIPRAYIPDSAIFPERYSAVEGKTISEPMTSGRPLIRHNIKDITRVDRFSDLLVPGQRALTLEVDGATSVEHMLEAGDKIDIAVKSKKSGALTLLLERITVLATGTVTTADPKKPGMYKNAEYASLTLGIDSTQVSRVLMAEKQGELVFLLRNGKDELRSRYVSAASPKIEVIIGKGGEGGVLSSISEELSVPDEQLRPHRSAEGRLLRKVSSTENEPESNTEVVAAHEGK